MTKTPFVLVQPKRSHALWLIMLCFLASGGLRLGVAGSALAEQVGEAKPPMAVSEDAEALLAAIQERSEQLDARERRIAERLALLEIAEEEFESRREALIAAEEALAATLAIADNAAENDIQRLTAVYQNMKPKKAAEIFNTMDPTFASGFLARMAPEAAADILTAMDTDAAYTISVIMASRNMNAPTE